VDPGLVRHCDALKPPTSIKARCRADWKS
jgi:hypothetical protein